MAKKINLFFAINFLQYLILLSKKEKRQLIYIEKINKEKIKNLELSRKLIILEKKNLEYNKRINKVERLLLPKKKKQKSFKKKSPITLWKIFFFLTYFIFFLTSVAFVVVLIVFGGK